MATVKKTSKNMIRGSWFGNATVSMAALMNYPPAKDGWVSNRPS